jgi:hypothetical protein
VKDAKTSLCGSIEPINGTACNRTESAIVHTCIHDPHEPAEACHPFQPSIALREPSDDEIANADVVSVVFIKCRIDYLKAQNEQCGCAGLLETCDECAKRFFAIGELEQCL